MKPFRNTSLVGLCLAAALAVPASAAPFGYGDRYTLPSAIRTIASGDLDGDGREDVVATLDDGTLRVWLAGANGALVAHPAPALAGPALGLALVDLVGGPALDLVLGIGSAPASLDVLAGDGSGGFSPDASYPAASNLEHLRVADLDGDGDRDVVGLSPGAAAIRVWLNGGGGALGTRIDSSGPSIVYDFAVGELNGGTGADLAIASYAPTWGLVVHAGDGAGGFAAILSLPIPGEMASVSIADLDADLANDVVLGHLRGPIALWGDGAGAFPARDTLDGWRGDEMSPVAVFDVDGDGALDLVAARSGNGQFRDWFAVLPGTGSRSFARAIEYELHPSEPEPGFRHLRPADVNGDGRPDLLVTTGRKTLDVIRHREGHGYQGIAEFTLDPGTIQLAAARRGSALPVQLVFGSASRIARLVPRADGSLVVADAVGIAGPATFRVADLDGDGRDDLLTDEPGGLGIAIQQPDGSFGAATSHGYGGFVALADLDADGDPDLVTEHPAGVLAVSVNDGAGGLAAAAATGETIPGAALAWAVGDWDGDGDQDLAVTRDVSTMGTDSLTLLLSDGAGGLARGSSCPIHVCAPATTCGDFHDGYSWQPRGLAASDVDRDGDLDLVGLEYGGVTGTYWWARNDLAGAFTPASHAASSIEENSRALEVADFDLDGWPDVASFGSKEGDLTWNYRLGDSGGSWTTGLDSRSCLRYGLGAAVGDLDGDQLPEWILLASGAPAGEVSGPDPNRALVFYNASPPPQPTAIAFSPVPAAPAPARGPSFVSVGPVPTGGDLRIRFSGRPGEPARVEVIDVRGRRAASEWVVVAPNGSGERRLRLGSLAPGVYWLRLVQDGRDATRRIAVVR